MDYMPTEKELNQIQVEAIANEVSSFIRKDLDRYSVNKLLDTANTILTEFKP